MLGGTTGRLVPAMLLCCALGAQSLASCSLWVLGKAPQACCPSHQTGGATIAAACCADLSQDRQTTSPSASTQLSLGHQPLPAFWSVTPPVDVRAGYHLTLPLAARGHTTVTLSALLI
jgi:hypothetical protein